MSSSEMKPAKIPNDIAEFCDQFGACREGREWGVANCKDMAEAWQTLKPEWLIWVATRKGVLDDCSLRLFACWSVRQVWHLLTDQRSKNAVEVAERFARGEAMREELTAAWDAAWDAARDAWDAACAARDAACAAACAAQAAYVRASFPNPFAKVAP